MHACVNACVCVCTAYVRVLVVYGIECHRKRTSRRARADDLEYWLQRGQLHLGFRSAEKRPNLDTILKGLFKRNRDGERGRVENVQSVKSDEVDEVGESVLRQHERGWARALDDVVPHDAALRNGHDKVALPCTGVLNRIATAVCVASE